ncbi:hypothetical protein SQ11_05100 [Nitrosospira sp. NpAV]|nr:hypothetical protein SQ11_05100 [Nitrosospira sp. NpAV]
MKGVLTGGTLLALGIPPGAFASAPIGRAEKFGLLLGNTGVDGAFAAGFHTAVQHAARGNGAVAAGMGLLPQVIKLKGGLLNDYELVIRLLEKSRNTRWVAVMDDGSAAIFTELVRNASGRLILLGSHASSDGTWRSLPSVSEFRHVWSAASPPHAAGSVLASSLVSNQSSFSIVENFLSSQAQSAGTMTMSNSIPGFLNFRLKSADASPASGADAVYLHCSGLSPSDGCASLGWNPAGTWQPVSQREPAHEAGIFAARGNGHPRYGWVESVGHAVTVAALSEESLINGPCCSRAFVHRSAAGKHDRRLAVAEPFTSFVFDT